MQQVKACGNRQAQSLKSGKGQAANHTEEPSAANGVLPVIGAITNIY